jgi:dTDP-4-dehydrorhamnose 3,5-epimerase-like enzyme
MTRVVGNMGTASLAANVQADSRGRLVAVDFNDVPFAVRRAFVITNVPAGTLRGGHSHRRGRQALFCLNGCVEVELRRGEATATVALRPDGIGLEVEAGLWSSQLYVEPGSELLVLASEPYDADNYETEPLQTA